MTPSPKSISVHKRALVLPQSTDAKSLEDGSRNRKRHSKLKSGKPEQAGLLFCFDIQHAQLVVGEGTILLLWPKVSTLMRAATPLAT